MSYGVHQYSPVFLAWCAASPARLRDSDGVCRLFAGCDACCGLLCSVKEVLRVKACEVSRVRMVVEGAME